MEKLAVEETDSWNGPASVARPLGRDLDTDHVTINSFELAPGETFAFGSHCHHDQEEVFSVLEGTATFEAESGDVSVAADEVIRFAPGEWQLGPNAGDKRVVALALGAPTDSRETEIRRACPDCGTRTPARTERPDDTDAVLTICEACGTVTDRYR